MVGRVAKATLSFLRIQNRLQRIRDRNYSATFQGNCDGLGTAIDCQQ